MPIAWWALVGLFAAMLINRAADCWLSPARMQCGLTRHPRRQTLVLIALPFLFAWLAWLFVHLMNLVGFENRLLVFFQWGWAYFSYNRAARLITGEHLLPNLHETSTGTNSKVPPCR